MEQPTEAQKKELWEWCGLNDKHDMVEYGLNDASLDWCRKCNLNGDEVGEECMPPIDLNNLFKYAVPKLYSWYMALDISGGTVAKVWLGNWNTRGMAQDKDPALALFWAIYEALKEANR